MLLQLVLLVIVPLSSPAALFEGSQCDKPLPGICRKLSDCPVALAARRKNKNHNLQRCGFVGFEEVVCCPNENGDDTDNTSSKNTQSRQNLARKSVNACEEISASSPYQVKFQILGGEDAALGDFPHMAALGYEKDDSDEIQWECGASLISRKFVLTAAHCIVKADGIPPSQVLLGAVDIKDVNAKRYKVERTIVHPEYQRRQRTNDIALVELDQTVASTAYIHPACLYHQEDEPLALVVSGWGHTSVNGKASRILQTTTLKPVPIRDCNKVYMERLQRTITMLQLCAGSADGTKDTCQGDSGGPIQIQVANRSVYNIVGVTSYGIGCGGSTPGIYTRVYGYLTWMESIVWP